MLALRRSSNAMSVRVDGMRILFISCGLPYPLDGGGQNLIYHWLEAASTVHDVDLLVIGQQTGAHQFIPGLPKVRIHFSPIQVSRTLWRQAFRQGACLVRSIPATSLVLMPPAVDVYKRQAGLGPGRVVDRLFHDRALPEWGGLQEIDWLVVVKRVNR